MRLSLILLSYLIIFCSCATSASRHIALAEKTTYTSWYDTTNNVTYDAYKDTDAYLLMLKKQDGNKAVIVKKVELTDERFGFAVSLMNKINHLEKNKKSFSPIAIQAQTDVYRSILDGLFQSKG